VRVFLSAGEASGDVYAGALVNEMRRLASGTRVPLRGEIREFLDTNVGSPEGMDSLDAVEVTMAIEDEFGIEVPDSAIQNSSTFDEFVDEVSPEVSIEQELPPLEFEGIGGKRLREAGARIVADSSGWGAISIVQALKVAPRIIPSFYRAKAALASGTPGLFVAIDFGYANIRLVRHARNRGWRVLYFMPPGSWRRDKQGKDLPNIAHEIVTPFEWSAEILRGMGASVHWFGHPIKQLMRDAHQTPAAGARDRIAVLPGSRLHEVELNLPVIAGALKGWEGTAEFAVASSIDPSELRSAWLRQDPLRQRDIFTQADIYGVFSRARAAIVCSGTATLEAALCHCPMVVVYRVTAGMVAEAKLLGLKRPEFISLPNILLRRMAVPELVHTDLTPEAVRSALFGLLEDGVPRNRQLEAFNEIDALLGGDDAITRTAELALSMLSQT
jgi:lipid-A-disaccharide synthase